MSAMHIKCILHKSERELTCLPVSYIDLVICKVNLTRACMRFDESIVGKTYLR